MDKTVLAMTGEPSAKTEKEWKATLWLKESGGSDMNEYKRSSRHAVKTGDR